MRFADARVWMEFINVNGDVVDRVLIAEFNHQNWADSFIAHENPRLEGGCRLVKEVRK